MRRILLLGGAVLAVFLFSLSVATAATIHTTDFIADGARTNFMGFESLPAMGSYGAFHEENGIRIEQVNGDLNGIQTNYTAWGGEGGRAWYPSGADRGYTSITRVGGGEFFDVGFLRGTGFSTAYTVVLYFELWDDGALVQAGSLGHQYSAAFLGFSGGGFDEIRVRDGRVSSTSSFYDNTLNALAIDSIELAGAPTPAPEPSAIVLLGSGILGLIVFGKRRRA